MIRNLCDTWQEGEDHAELLVQRNVVCVVASRCHTSCCFEEHVGAIINKTSCVGVYSKLFRVFSRLC